MKQKTVRTLQLQSVTKEICNKAYDKKRQDLTQSAIKFKSCIENHKKETAVIRTYGTECH